MGRGHGSTRGGGAGRGASALGSGGVAGFESFDSVYKHVLADNKFRVGVSKLDNGTYQLVTTNAPLDNGGTAKYQPYYGGEKEVMNVANALKAGKTLNYAMEHRYD